MGMERVIGSRLIALLVGLSCASVLVGCTSADEANAPSAEATAPGVSETSGGTTGSGGVPEDVTVGLVSINAASPGIKLYRDVFTKLAEQKGWTVKSVDTAGDMVAAVNQGKQWLNEGVDAIVNNTIPNTAMTEVINAAKAKNVPYFSVSSGYVEGVTNETAANDWASGAQLATALVDAIGRKGNILVLTWSGLQPVRDRQAALQAVVSDMKDIKIVKTVELKVPGWADDAYKQVSNFLQSNKDVQAIWLPWDDFASDVARAVEEAGLADKIVIGGFDLDNSAADLLRKNGPFKMSSALNIPAMAASQVAMLEKALAGQQVPPTTYVPNCLATTDNIGPAGSRESVEFWSTCYAEPLNLENALKTIS